MFSAIVGCLDRASRESRRSKLSLIGEEKLITRRRALYPHRSLCMDFPVTLFTSGLFLRPRVKCHFLVTHIRSPC